MGQLAKGTRGTTWTMTKEPNKSNERKIEILQDRNVNGKYYFRVDRSRTVTTIDFSRRTDDQIIGNIEGFAGEMLYRKMKINSNFDLIAELIYLAKIKIQEQTES